MDIPKIERFKIIDQILQKGSRTTHQIHDLVNKELNERLDAAVVQVTRQFEKDGFPNCVLKGQGNALMYPIPEQRSPGDIDLWPMADRGRIFKYVKKDFPNTKMLYHHLEYLRKFW